MDSDRAQGVHKLSFRPSQTRRDMARLLVCPDPGGPPPEDMCALLPAAPPPRPCPNPGPSTCWALLAVWTLHAAHSATGARPQGRGPPTGGGPWCWPRMAGHASGPLPACWSLNMWMGRIPGAVGSQGRAACCPSAPDCPQGTCLQGGLLSTPHTPVTFTLPPQPTPTPNSPQPQMCLLPASSSPEGTLS